MQRIVLGPKPIPQGTKATVVKIHYGPVNEFAESDGRLRTFRVLPSGDLWLMPTDYVLPHVYRTITVARYYTSRDTWIEDGVEYQERPYALTT
jgi:hypothetical protein